MERCPLCRAALHGADTCRRCRADLRTAQEVERDGQALVGAAIHRLALDNAEIAELLLRRVDAPCNTGSPGPVEACDSVITNFAVWRRWLSLGCRVFSK